MTDALPIHGVYLSETYDLRQAYGRSLDAEDVVIHQPDEVDDHEAIRFAVCWAPGTDAFAAYPNLELAMSIGAGVDALMTHPGIEPDVAIARVRDPHQADLMAGFSAHEILHYEREFDTLMGNAATASWKPLPMRAPADAVVAVLGNGTMGQAVIASLQALGFTVRVASRSQPDAPRPGVTYLTGADAAAEAATGADYLVNILPLTVATENVLNAALFARMNTGARIIQIGRGEHLVEADLLAALDSGQLAGATLDVFRTEPLPNDHPFWTDPRIRVTPHVASDSIPEIVTEQVLETARSLRNGEQPRLVVSRVNGY